MTKQRTTDRSRLRGTWAVVVVALANLVFQPCVMAADSAAGHPCPHCPVEAAEHPAAHGNDAGGVAEVAGCDYVDVYSLESRGIKSGPRDLPVDSAVLPVDVAGVVPMAATGSASIRVHRRDGPPPHRPLNVLHCVYLK